MIRCAVNNGSKAAGRLSPAPARLFNTSSSSLKDPELPKASEDAKPSKPSKPLPISPLMDPAFLAARQRHSIPKKAPKKEELTPFQRQLQTNPYALALATPVRQCKVTRQRLPKFFLQGFNLRAHPETGVPWWMPSDLVRNTGAERLDGPGVDGSEDNGSGATEGHAEVDSKQIFGGRESTTGALEGLRETHSEDQVTTDAPENIPRHHDNRLTGPKIHIALSKGLFKDQKDIEKGFVDSQLFRHLPSRQLLEAARLRPDTATFILELMRRRTVEDLKWLVQLKRGYIVGCKSWEDALAKKQVGAYLWTGGKTVPAEYSTLDVGVTKKQKVPLHNLQRLLGTEHLKKLDEECSNGIFQNEVLAIRHRRATIQLQMRLWKLQGYLAEFRE